MANAKINLKIAEWSKEPVQSMWTNVTYYNSVENITEEEIDKALWGMAKSSKSGGILIELMKYSPLQVREC